MDFSIEDIKALDAMDVAMINENQHKILRTCQMQGRRAELI